MTRIGGNWAIGSALGALALGAFAAAAAAGRPGGPACLDQAAAEAIAGPGFVTYTDSLSPACVRIRLTQGP